MAERKTPSTGDATDRPHTRNLKHLIPSPLIVVLFPAKGYTLPARSSRFVEQLPLKQPKDVHEGVRTCHVLSSFPFFPPSSTAIRRLAGFPTRSRQLFRRALT